MPTITFEKLSDDKKDIIESAAVKEFSTYTYDQVSINRIIQDINMPRGSFYLYFENKEDLYLYIIKKYIDFSVERLIQKIKDCNGDVINAYKLSLEDIIEYCNKGPHAMLVKNFLLGLSHRMGFKVSKPEKKEIVCNIFSSINIDYLEEEYKEELFIVLDLLTHTLIHSLTEYLVMGIPLDKIKHKYYKQLKMIANGIYKEEEK